MGLSESCKDLLLLTKSLIFSVPTKANESIIFSLTFY
nr:MAG TPA: hypothetical protein [Caudoviricetes sp.]